MTCAAAFLGLDDSTASCQELAVHVGDSALLGCVFQSTGEKPVAKVDWIFSSGAQSKVMEREGSCCGGPWPMVSAPWEEGASGLWVP